MRNAHIIYLVCLMFAWRVNGSHLCQSKSPWKDAKGRFTKYLSTKLDVRIVLPCYFYSKEMMHLV